MASIGNDIEGALVTAFQAVTFTGIAVADIKARALPKVGETLDTIPCLLIAAGNEIEEWEHMHFEGGVSLVYPFECAFVTATNRDFSTAVATIRDWRQTLRRAIPDALATATTVWKIEPRLGNLFDRAQLSQNYGYSSLVLKVYSCETE